MAISEERLREAIASRASAATFEPDDLIRQYIEEDPNQRGVDRARIRGHGVSVAALITALGGDSIAVDEVAKDYQLPEQVMLAALCYYERHKGLIDARIALNEASFEQRDRPVEHTAGSRG